MDITFGALCDPIAKQTGMSRRKCRGLQEMADAITLLKIAQIISDSEAHRARVKLVRRIERVVKGGE